MSKAKTATEAKATDGKDQVKLVISPPRFKTIEIKLTGISPYMQNRFSGAKFQVMKEKQEQGQQAKKGKAKKARNFDDDYEGAFHVSKEGWYGVPATALRNACIDACRAVDFKMTHAKMSIFVLADGYDRIDDTPLVKLVGSEPRRTEMTVRNATGVADIRVRPVWDEWCIEPRIQFDEDQFSLTDMVNLLMHAGMKIGIGEGRPFSRTSAGMGFGQFMVGGEAKVAA